MFLSHDVCIIDELENYMETEGATAFTRLYEIGCGGGQVIEYLHNRFPEFDRLTGIDLGKEQVEQNQATFSQNRIEFVNTDACEWIPENAIPGCVILTNGGVFEYFLQSELEDLFSQAARSLSPVAICLIETIATDHDLNTELDSLVYGREMAFSHNYPYLLKSAGFEIVHCSERAGESIDGGGRWLRILGVK